MTTREHAIGILKTGYGLKLLYAASDYTAPFFWGLSPQLGVERKIHHGSAFFLNCGGDPFAITAAHVYKAYLGNKSDDHSVLAQIGGLRFVPEERLIDRDDILDLATFRIDEREIPTIDKNVHVHPEPLWPPLPPKEGQGVFYAGFPLTDRSPRDWKSLDFGLHAALLTATAIDSRKIVCQFTREDWVDVQGTGFPPENAWIGGMSGAALWTLGEKPIVKWRLAGIISEFSQSFELLYAVRADPIRPDGTLIH